MSKIDEWNPVFPRMGASSRPPGGTAAPAAGRAPNLVDVLYGGLMAMKPRSPRAVHFYLGEGLRWIRVGFRGNALLTPSAARDVGQVIESCIARPDKPLYFHALRPHDMLFFLKGGKEESIGMPPECFGAPLDEVLDAWGFKPSVGARKRGQSTAHAPYSHRAKSKP